MWEFFGSFQGPFLGFGVRVRPIIPISVWFLRVVSLSYLEAAYIQKRSAIFPATRDVAPSCRLRAAPLCLAAWQCLVRLKLPHLVPRPSLKLEEVKSPMSKAGERTREWTRGRMQGCV